MADHLYTFILDLSGGTFTSQAPGKSVREALKRWASHELPRIPDLAATVAAEIRQQVGHEDPTPVDGLQNVWCAGFLVDSTPCKFALLNIVETKSKHIHRPLSRQR